MLRQFRNLLWNLFQKSKRDADLDAEVSGFADMVADEKMRAGMNAKEARRAARLELGGVEQVKERVRAARSGAWLDSLLQDVRYGARMLRKSPGFAIVATVTLALGIGANTTIFSIVDAVLLRPLPYKHPDRLVVIWQSDAAHMESGGWFDTYSQFQEWTRSTRSFEKLAAFSWAQAGATLAWKGERERVLAIPVSVDFFSILGVLAERGRAFVPEDLNQPCSVVLSHKFWKDDLGGSPGLVGNTLTLDDKPCVVSGVMPRDFSYYPKQTQIWTLITPAHEYEHDPWHSMVGVLGRLKPGTTRAAAQDELTSLQERMPDETATMAAMHLQPDVLDLQREFTWLTGRNLRATVIVLFASVALVLLIACLNVGSMLLGRAGARQKELGLRQALGSSRARLMRLLLTECALLSGIGALIGTLFAAIGLGYLNAIDAADLPPGNPVVVNWQVLAFVTLIAGIAVVLFGLSPAWSASRHDISDGLRGFGRMSQSGVTRRGAKFTVGVEVALSVILLTGAGLLITSLARLSSTPLGFRPEHLLMAEFGLPEKSYPNPEDWIRFCDRFQAAVVALPAIEGAAFSPQVAWPAGTLTVQGKPSGSADERQVGEQVVSPDYFRVMEIPFLRGRPFDERDREHSQGAAIINEAVADQYFPREDPIGRAIKLSEDDDPWLTIVGIVGNVKRTTVFKEMGYVVEPCVYRPLRQKPMRSGALFVRSAVDPSLVAREVRDAMGGIDPTLPPPEVQTMTEWLAQFFTQPRFRAALFSAFGALALFLAAVGIYGAIWQSVSQRTQEIGIRMAVGAQPRDVLNMIVGEGMRVVLLGLGTGIAGAIVLARALRNLLYGVQPTDPGILALTCLILLTIACVACFIPARRAIAIDPIDALRHE